MAQSEQDALEVYKEQLAQELDTAAGSWSGELGELGGRSKGRYLFDLFQFPENR